MGALTPFRRAEAVLDRPIEDSRLGVLDPRDGSFVDLAPLLTYKVCPVCDGEEIFSFNGKRGRLRYSFLSYTTSHECDEEAVADLFAERGLTWPAGLGD
jgi:hypothetical protein